MSQLEGAEDYYSQLQDDEEVRSMLINLMNPRLSKYGNAFKLAGSLIVFQVFLTGLATFWYRHVAGVAVKQDVMFMFEANNPHEWEDGSQIVGSYVTVLNYNDIFRYATPVWFGYNQSWLRENVPNPQWLQPQWWWHGGALVAGESNDYWFWWISHQDAEQKYNQTWYDTYKTIAKGAPGKQFACHLLIFNCSDYSDDTACDDNFVCGSESGIVSITSVVPSPWLVCFSDAVAFVGYFEIVITTVFLGLYMCVTQGPLWFSDPRQIRNLAAKPLSTFGDSDGQPLTETGAEMHVLARHADL